MINRRKFTNTLATALGAMGLLPASKVLAAAKLGQADIAINEGARTFDIKHRYLNLPVTNDGDSHSIKLIVDGEVERSLYIALTDTQPDWWAFMDMSPYQGKSVSLQMKKPVAGFKGLASIVPADDLIDADNLYREKRRPQFHFSSRRGWLNDPNGLVYYKGEYHLFYQSDPYRWVGWVKHWGHAVSKDLVHWEELPIALYPDEHGAMWSGSAVVDWHNTAGLEKGDEKTLIAMYTAAAKPFTQGLAYSNDRGRTWEKYANNPVIPKLNHDDRDPKVIWYAPENKWIMVIWLDKVGPPKESVWDFTQDDWVKHYYDNPFGFFSSKDLKTWEKMSEIHLPGDRECPEFFELPVDGNAKDTRWILYGARGLYFIGHFDGSHFKPESGPHAMQQGNGFYASQTFNDIPQADGRRIVMPWAMSQTGLRGGPEGEPLYKDMPFNQMMGLPVVLTLRSTEQGLKLFVDPVDELKSLRNKAQVIKAKTIREGDNPLADIRGELLEIEVDIAPANARTVRFDLRGIPVTYDVQAQTLTCEDKTAPLAMEDGRITLRMLVDRTSIDIFGNGGQLYMPMGMIVPEDNHTLALAVKGGEAQIYGATVYELKSAWQ